MRLAEISVRRPVLMTMALSMLVVLGLVSYFHLPLDLVPRVDIPVVTVITILPGAGPEEVENLVSRVIEDAVSSVNGIDWLKSDSQDNLSAVTIFFKDTVNIDVAASDVRDKINAILYLLPDEAEQPQLLKLDINAQPVLTLGLVSRTLSIGQLTDYVDRLLKDRLANAAGVAQVDVLGGRKREIQFLVREETLKRYGLSLAWLAGALSSASIDVPGGHITQDRFEFSLKFAGEADRVDDFRNLELVLPGGGTLKLDEICTVHDTFVEERQRSRFGGEACLFLVIKKRSDANAVATVRNVRSLLKDLEATLPGGTRFLEARETATYVQDSLNDLYSNMGIGVLLTALVLFVFLRTWQATLIAALAIPLSVLATFTFILALGFSLNMMSLMALAISVGILVNNAIVVLENIVTHREWGEESDEAAIRGTGEIFIAVVGGTLTNVVVFVPIGFMSGIIGKFFKEFGLTAAVATLVSLLVSFTLTPMMAAWLLRGNGKAGTAKNGKKQSGGLLSFFDRLTDGAKRTYLSTLKPALRRPLLVLGLAVGLFVATLFLAPYVGFEFITNADQGVFNITLRMPPGSTLEQTDRAIRQVEAVAATIPELSHIYTKVGKTENVIGGGSEAITIGEVTVKLVDKDKRQRGERLIAQSLVEPLSRIPGATVSIIFYGVIGAEEMPLQVEVIGPDMDRLQALSEEVHRRIEAVPGTVDIDTSFITGKPELKIHPDRLRIRAAGLVEQALGIELRGRYEGLIPLKFRDGSREYDARLKLADADRKNIQQLLDSDLVLPGGRAVPLRELADVEETVMPAKITRKDRQRMISISGRTEGRSYGQVLNDIKMSLSDLDLPEGYRIEYAGMAKRMEDMIQLVYAFCLAVLLTFMLLAALLESWIHPFTIMFTLPLAIIGVIYALFITGATVSIFSLMAVVMLVGIVVNNGILIIDHATEGQKAGIDNVRVILSACRDRFRAILMTAIATVLAMVPLALGMGAGGEMRAPMAIVSIGGLLVSTVLSLYVIPSAWLMVEQARKRWFARSSA